MKSSNKKSGVLLTSSVCNPPKDKRKRLPDVDEVDLDIEPSSKRSNTSQRSENISVLDCERPAPPRPKSKLKKTTISQGLEKDLQSNAKAKSFQPGEKTALLAAIRKRINELEARTVYIRHLPRYTSEAQLKKFCPTSVAIKLSSKRRGGHRRGHAFIEFKSEQAARAAVDSTDGKLIADRPISLQLCSQRIHDTLKGNWIPADRRQLAEFSMSTLAVSCVPRVANKEELQKLFPTSESIEIVRSANKIPTGLCIIRFSTEGDALEAFTKQNGVKLHNTALIVNFAYKKGYCSKYNATSPGVTSPKTLTDGLPKHHSVSETSKSESTQKAFDKQVVVKKKKATNKLNHKFPKELQQLPSKVKKGSKRLPFP